MTERFLKCGFVARKLTVVLPFELDFVVNLNPIIAFLEVALNVLGKTRYAKLENWLPEKSCPDAAAGALGEYPEAGAFGVLLP